MIGATFVALATAWTVVAADAIAESARTDGRSIVVFGTTLGNPGSPGGIWILIGAAIVAMLLWAIAISILHGRRLQRRVDAQLEQGWLPVGSRGIPAMPAAPYPPRFDPEIVNLERRRDGLLQELRQVQRELEVARRVLDQADWYDQIEEALIVLPELDDADELASRRTSRREPLEG
jgi:type VI protein secretion system component VasK